MRILILLLIFGTAFAQDASAPPSDEAVRVQSLYQQLATPSAGHQNLARFAGEWQVTVEWYPAKDQPAVESQAINSSRMIFGGRFLRSDFHGNMMGKPFTGIGIEGYDNFKQKYTMVWLDETSTSMFTAEGAADSTGNTITYLGKRDDPASGQSNLDVKYVGKWIDDNHHRFSIYEHPGTPEEYQSVEMIYTRQ